MSDFLIGGGRKLYGEVDISSAKNSVLPLISACVLAKDQVVFHNVKPISDVVVMCELIKSLGGDYAFKKGDLYIFPLGINSFVLERTLTEKVRASVFFVGSLLSKFGRTKVSESGGCNIGSRPIDVHISGLKQLGVTEQKSGEYELFEFTQKPNCNTSVKLRYPSVGATENVILASVFCGGEVTVYNCAKEPEIVDLQNFLNLLGAKIKGAGSAIITIQGVDKFEKRQVEFTPIYDRIEAGTFALICAFCGGEIALNDISREKINILLKNISNNACKIYQNNDKIYILSKGGGKSNSFVRTGPYPMFPTDLQPQFVTYCLGLDGVSRVKEEVFDARFGYVKELLKMNAKIEVVGQNAYIEHSELCGSTVCCGDLRGGVALCMAGLKAEGVTLVKNVEYIDRGYYEFEKKIASLGGDIERITF